jgi:SAM-dependent methyltransferase
VIGDAAALPMQAGRFEAVISVHVFHLIATWRLALDEVRRVLAPGGVFLTGYEWRPPDTPGARLMERWREIVRARGFGDNYVGPHDFDDIRAALEAMGGRLAERAVGEWTVTRTLARQIETIEHRTWSSTWNVPAEFFPRCLAELRAWAAAEYGRLDQAHQVPHRFIWQRFEGLA